MEICGGKNKHMKRDTSEFVKLVELMKTDPNDKYKTDYDPSFDETLDYNIELFSCDVHSNHVPLGVALGKMANLLNALDWHLGLGNISRGYARDMVQWAAEEMDKRFDMDYERLPR